MCHQAVGGSTLVLKVWGRGGLIQNRQETTSWPTLDFPFLEGTLADCSYKDSLWESDEEEFKSQVPHPCWLCAPV